MRPRVSRARTRGFVHVSTTLEAAAVLVWFVVLIVGEKVVGDAAVARRASELAASQTAAAAVSRLCRDGSADAVTLGDVEARASARVLPDGAPDPGAFLRIVAGLSLGQHPTLGVHSEPFHAVVGRAEHTGAAAPAPLRGGPHTFVGEREVACPEPSQDSPKSSIDRYRTSIFEAKVKGW